MVKILQTKYIENGNSAAMLQCSAIPIILDQ